MQTRDLVGQQFGNYRLVRLIGSGGYAEVYLAEHIDISNLVRAIKVLTGTNLPDEQRAQFLAEARTIANMQNLNSHIVQIHDFGIQTSQNSADDGVPYLVMEYAAAGTLRHLYPHNKRMPLDRIVFYTNQVAEALQCAHDQKPSVVHRDIKPENMLLRSPDHLLLSDFGIAITGNTTSLAAPIKETEVLGTVAYMAPERLSKHTRRASDQYSLAIVVYEWLCGSPPFDGTEKEIIYKQLKMPPPPLYLQYPHITQEIESVVMRALAKDSAARYPTVKEFAIALESAIQKAQLPQNQPTLVPQAITPKMPAPAAPQKVQPPIVLPQPLAPVVLPAPQETIWPRVQQTPQPVATVVLPPSQEATWPRVQQAPQAASATVQAPPQQLLSTTVQSPMRQATPFVAPSKAGPVLQKRQEAQSFFVFSPQFARDQRFAWFRGSGIVLNVFAAIIIGLLQQNIYVLLGGLTFALVMFTFCVRAIEEKIALLFGTMVALYWLFIGWETGAFLASLLDLNPLVPSLFMSSVFFGASLFLHVWYISRKNI